MSRLREVVLVLPYVNSYRAPLLLKVASSLEAEGILFKVFFAAPSGPDVSRRDAISFRGSQLHQYSINLLGRRILIRTLPKGWYSADLFIMEHAVKNLDSLFVLLCRRILRKKTVLWGHGSTITKPTSWLSRATQRVMVNLSTHYFAYTDGSAVRAARLGAAPRDIFVLNNSVDTAKLRQLAANVEPRENSTLFYVGGLDASKNIDMLLRIGERLSGALSGFKLIVGGRGELEHIVARSGRPWLDYRGHMNDRDKVLAAAESSAMIITGRVGLAVVDAFALGLPTLTRRWEFHAPEFEYLNSSNSIVADDENALFAHALELLSNNALKDALSAGASASAELLTIDSMAERFIRGVRGALDNSSD